MTSVDIFPFTANTYWSYDNGWGYQDQHWSAYAGPYFGPDNHLVLLNNEDGTVVLQYIGRYPPVELWRGEVLTAFDFGLLVRNIEDYRLAYCERFGIDPRRNFEHEIVLAQHGEPVEYRCLRFVPEPSGAMSPEEDARFRLMTQGGRLATLGVQGCVEETGAMYGHDSGAGSVESDTIRRPRNKLVRAVSLLLLWSMGSPVLLMLGVIALDGHPRAKLAALGIGVVLIIAVALVLASRISRHRADVTRTAPSKEPFKKALEAEAGWAALREALYRDIDEVARRYGVEATIVSDKEKWGELRIRRLVSGDEPARSDANVEIGRLIDAAANRSSETCICCGRPAWISKIDGRILPLCPWHNRQPS